MVSTSKELAEWIYDRVQQGKHEEVGSFDCEVFDGHEISIMVCGEEDDEDNRYFEIMCDGYFHLFDVGEEVTLPTIMFHVEKSIEEL